MVNTIYLNNILEASCDAELPVSEEFNGFYLFYTVRGQIDFEFDKNAEPPTAVSVSAKKFILINSKVKFKQFIRNNSLILYLEFIYNDCNTLSEAITDSNWIYSIPHCKEFIKEFGDYILLTDTQNVKNSIHNLYQTNSCPAEDIFRNFGIDLAIKDFFLETFKCFRNKSECAERNAYLRKILAYIISNYYKNFTIKDLSKELNISISYLQKLIKEEMHTSFRELMWQRKIIQATTLLCKTNLSVERIAKEVGFNSRQSFINIFKKLMKQTPMEYRKKELKPTFTPPPRQINGN